MERITPVDPHTAQGRARELLDAVKAKLGIVPNMTRAMAVSPSVLEAYLGFSGALGHGILPARVREQLALDVSEVNHCDYCVSAHGAVGKHAIDVGGILDQPLHLRSHGAKFGDGKINQCGLELGKLTAAEVLQNVGFGCPGEGGIDAHEIVGFRTKLEAFFFPR